MELKDLIFIIIAIFVAVLLLIYVVIASNCSASYSIIYLYVLTREILTIASLEMRKLQQLRLLRMQQPTVLNQRKHHQLHIHSQCWFSGFYL